MTIIKQALKRFKRILLRSNWFYKIYLHFKGYRPLAIPSDFSRNAVLKNSRELEDTQIKFQELKLIPHADPCKNWDTLAMLSYILKNTDREAAILDAGSETSSSALQNLFLHGYRNLTGINLLFKKPYKIGSIVYEYGDITKTRFRDQTFDVILCQSVIEHGVDIAKFFSEAARILNLKGLLVMSTDYYQAAIPTHNLRAFGAPVKIFDKNEILHMLTIASEYGLKLESSLDLDVQEKPIHWMGLDYTFVVFALRKIS